uniref:glutamine--fructose-6-phosphate transaminase (isomerizing) n=1 Tax=Myxobolus squamalis TaxID=59785 RepID=A0A6B2FX76_MYXSQ
MCGIFGYLNFHRKRSRKEILAILVNGLKRLEYRGYDSAGIAFDSDILLPNNALMTKIIKQSGRVKELENKIIGNREVDEEKLFDMHFGIAHTRWATHGEPSETNSHPQTSGIDNEFVVVHNGIISNYKDIQKYLKNRGYEQSSQTDTELIVLLMKYIYEKHQKLNEHLTFVQLVSMVLELLDGAYALVFKSSYFPDQAIATRKSSPLIVGLKFEKSESNFNVPIISHSTPFKTEYACATVVPDHFPNYSSDRIAGAEYFFASDASAIIEHTKRVIYLEDCDIVHVHDGCKFTLK